VRRQKNIGRENISGDKIMVGAFKIARKHNKGHACTPQNLPTRLKVSTPSSYIFIPPDIQRLAKKQPTEAIKCEELSGILNSCCQLSVSTDNVIEINHTCKKLGSVLQHITKCDIKRLDDRMRYNQVSHRTFDSSEICKEMSLPVQTLLSYWIGEPGNSSKGDTMLFIHNILMRLVNKNCIPPLIQILSEFVSHVATIQRKE